MKQKRVLQQGQDVALFLANNQRQNLSFFVDSCYHVREKSATCQGLKLFFALRFSVS